jgi:hypothetical protein
MKTLLIILTVLSSFLANFEQRTFQADFNVAVTEEANNPLNYPGTITTHGPLFSVAMFGIEAAYDGKTLYMYNTDMDELTLSNPTEQELIETNPFLYARTMADKCDVTERDSENGTQTIITLTSKDSSVEIGRYILHVRTADLMPLSLEMREGRKTTTLTLMNPRFVMTEPKYVIEPNQSTFVNDMRF